MAKQCFSCGKPIEESAFRCIACFSWMWFKHIGKDKDDPTRQKRGNIYFIADEHERVKIGFATDIERRFKTLQNSNADELTLLLVIPGTYKMEKSLHRKFSHLRIRDTEWFEQGSEIMEFVTMNYESDNK